MKKPTLGLGAVLLLTIVAATLRSEPDAYVYCKLTADVDAEQERFRVSNISGFDNGRVATVNAGQSNAETFCIEDAYRDDQGDSWFIPRAPFNFKHSTGEIINQTILSGTD